MSQERTEEVVAGGRTYRVGICTDATGRPVLRVACVAGPPPTQAEWDATMARVVAGVRGVGVEPEAVTAG